MSPLRSIALLVLPLTACTVEEAVQEHAFDEPIDHVVLDVGGIDVDIVAVEGLEGARVVEHVRWQGERPDVRLDVVGGELHVEFACQFKLTIGTSCSVDLAIEVPATAGVRGQIGSGDLSIDGVGGGVDLSVGSGDVTLSGILGNVVLDVGSGDVTGHDLAATTLDVAVGSGDVDLEQGVAFDSAWIETRSGDVTLVVPAGSYDLSTSSSSGDITVSGIDDDSTAATSVDLHTGSGDVTLVGR